MEMTIKYDAHDVHQIIKAGMERHEAELVSASINCMNNWPATSYISATCQVVTQGGKEAHCEIGNNDLFAMLYHDLGVRGYYCEQLTVIPRTTTDSIQQEFIVEATGVNRRYELPEVEADSE